MDDFQWEEEIRYRFENTTDGHFKFYEITLTEMSDGSWVVETAYGSMKPGAHVTRKTLGWEKKFGAQQLVEENIQKRIDHGYKEV